MLFDGGPPIVFLVYFNNRTWRALLKQHKIQALMADNHELLGQRTASEHREVPLPGEQALALEKKLKRWLCKEVDLVPGTHENWFTASLEVQSLAELKARGVETDLF